MRVLLLAFGLFFSVASVGGNEFAPFFALMCGWWAGKQPQPEPPQ